MSCLRIPPISPGEIIAPSPRLPMIYKEGYFKAINTLLMLNLIKEHRR